MTLNEIKASTKSFLVPADVAGLIGCNAQSIRLQAKRSPEALGFPVVCVGTRTMIPRKPFLAFIGEGEQG